MASLAIDVVLTVVSPTVMVDKMVSSVVLSFNETGLVPAAEFTTEVIEPKMALDTAAGSKLLSCAKTACVPVIITLAI